MASQAVIGANFNQQCIPKQENEIQAKIGALQIHQLQALEKNRRNKLLQMGEIRQEDIASRQKQLGLLNQQLEEQLSEQEQVTAEIQQTNHSLQRQVEQLQCRKDPRPVPSQLQPPTRSETKEGHNYSLTHSHWPYDKSQPYAWRMTMNWRDGGKAPFRMSRGAAVVNGDVAYFMNWSGDLCFYNSASKQWGKLPKYPYQYGSLAVINGQPTAIGGCTDFCDKKTYTNKLLSLRKMWAEVFPAMPTKRRDTSAVTSEEHLIVAGGMCDPFINASISTVEVMDLKTLVWSTVASLPHPYAGPSGIICGSDQLYILGGSSDKGETKSVLTCSLTELLLSSSSPSSTWHRVADAPAYLSTCAAVNGELLAVGGCDKKDQATANIHKYNPTTNSWDLISNMPTARYNCLTAILSTSEIMVIGGDIHWNCTLANTEIASV